MNFLNIFKLSRREKAQNRNTSSARTYNDDESGRQTKASFSPSFRKEVRQWLVTICSAETVAHGSSFSSSSPVSAKLSSRTVTVAVAAVKTPIRTTTAVAVADRRKVVKGLFATHDFLLLKKAARPKKVCRFCVSSDYQMLKRSFKRIKIVLSAFAIFLIKLSPESVGSPSRVTFERIRLSLSY
mgnify:CR=1 FL=1